MPHGYAAVMCEGGRTRVVPRRDIDGCSIYGGRAFAAIGRLLVLSVFVAAAGIVGCASPQQPVVVVETQLDRDAEPASLRWMHAMDADTPIELVDGDGTILEELLPEGESVVPLPIPAGTRMLSIRWRERPDEVIAQAALTAPPASSWIAIAAGTRQDARLFILDRNELADGSSPGEAMIRVFNAGSRPIGWLAPDADDADGASDDERIAPGTFSAPRAMRTSGDTVRLRTPDGAIEQRAISPAEGGAYLVVRYRRGARETLLWHVISPPPRDAR